MFNLQGRTAIVTGGGSGIGRAIALRLGDEGCRLGIFDLDEAAAAETVRIAEGRGHEAVAAFGDVSRRADVDAAVAVLTEALGPADILVNSAGILRIGALLEQSYEDFGAQFRVNVDGVFHACQAVVPSMVERRRGSVLNIASWLGKRGMRLYGGYAAPKFAVIGMTQTLALEVASAGVRVNALCPGLIVDTGMRVRAEAVHRQLGLPSAEERAAQIPLGRLGKPDDVARAAAFLVSDEAEYMTGQAINVTGGFWLS